MKNTKVVFIWFALSLLLGTILYFTSSGQNRHVIFIILGSLGLIVGLLNILFMSFFSSSKSTIFEEAVKMYNGKMNIFGKPEFTIKGRKIILDYDKGNGYLQTFEYIITNKKSNR